MHFVPLYHILLVENMLERSVLGVVSDVVVTAFFVVFLVAFSVVFAAVVVAAVEVVAAEVTTLLFVVVSPTAGGAQWHPSSATDETSIAVI